MLTNANSKTGEAQQPLCLSVRQPWAWLIAHGWKNIENRTRRTQVRGRILIHASKGMTRGEYQACVLFVAGFAPQLAQSMPAFGDYPLGGIVGETTILDCVDRHASEWFCGPVGYVLGQSKPMPFTACRGSLGFFRFEAGRLTP